MSKKHVPPPAANAAEPVAMPSHSVRPGSLKCTCGSITPGKMCRPVASISSFAIPVMSPISTIFPSVMAREATATESLADARGRCG